MRLIERVGWSGPDIDKEAGVIKGVKLLGWESSNGRRYRKNAVEKALKLYENKGVNLDHRKRDDRSVVDGFGKVANAEVRADGLYGDIPYLKTHPFAAQFIEAAERMPELLGVSQVAEGVVSSDDGTNWVEEIQQVESVDLVRYPATTKSLFESEVFEEGLRKDVMSAIADDSLTDEQIKDKLKQFVDPPAEPPATPQGDPPTPPADPPPEPQEETIKTAVAAATESLQAKVDQLEGTVVLLECLLTGGVDVMALSEEQHSKLKAEKTREGIVQLTESFPKQSRGLRPQMPPGRNGKTGSYQQLREQMTTELNYQ